MVMARQEIRECRHGRGFVIEAVGGCILTLDDMLERNKSVWCSCGGECGYANKAAPFEPIHVKADDAG